MVAWKLARLCWALHIERLGNHFEDVAFSGKGWLERDAR
jgi:hypothetical protein